MANRNTQAMSNEEWLARGSQNGSTGKNAFTYVNPQGDNSVAWVVDNPSNPRYNSLNADGQTYAQGTADKTFYNSDAPGIYTVYDGAQNALGFVLGDGTVLRNDGVSRDTSKTGTFTGSEVTEVRDARDAALAEARRSLSESNYLDGVTTRDDANRYFIESYERDRLENEQRIKEENAAFMEWQAARYQARRAQEAALEAQRNAALQAADEAERRAREHYGEQQRQAEAGAALRRLYENEVFNANGLNTGAAGQAELARSNVLAGNLTSIGNARADTLSDIEAQRAEIETKYRQAVLEALADNEQDAANALVDAYEQSEKLYSARAAGAYDRIGSAVSSQPAAGTVSGSAPVGKSYTSAADFFNTMVQNGVTDADARLEALARALMDKSIDPDEAQRVLDKLRPGLRQPIAPTEGK